MLRLEKFNELNIFFAPSHINMASDIYFDQSRAVLLTQMCVCALFTFIAISICSFYLLKHFTCKYFNWSLSSVILRKKSVNQQIIVTEGVSAVLELDNYH